VKLGFGEWILDREAGRLSGPAGEVRLRPHAFRMLEVLAEQAPKILSQEELLNRVWGVEHLSPSSVKQAVSEVRQALGDEAARPAVIETVHRRGYRFIAAVERIEEAPEPKPIPIPAAAPVSSAVPQGRRLIAALAMPVLAGLSLLALVPHPLAEPESPIAAPVPLRQAAPAMPLRDPQPPAETAARTKREPAAKNLRGDREKVRAEPEEQESAGAPFRFQRGPFCQPWPGGPLPCRPKPPRLGFGPRPPRPGFHGPPNPLWPV
jgi:DNA-binding winged helix-turn-helix (wHTH) protein